MSSWGAPFLLTLSRIRPPSKPKPKTSPISRVGPKGSPNKITVDIRACYGKNRARPGAFSPTATVPRRPPLSCRRGGRPTIERTASFVLNARLLNSAKLRPGAHGSVVLRFEYEGEPFPVSLTVDTRERSFPRIELAHRARTETGQAMKYRIALATTRPYFGGVRWWFRCPRTSARATKLYLPLGGNVFANRQYYRLGHQVTRESPADRMARKARKLNLALGGNGDDEPEKPKGMRWKTFHRKMDQWAAVENAVDGF